MAGSTQLLRLFPVGICTESTNLTEIPGGATYIGGRQAKKPSNREWFELHCCGSSQEWA